MARSRCLTAVRVISYVVGAQDVRPIVNFDVAMQLVGIADLLLADRADDSPVFELRGGPAGARFVRCFGGQTLPVFTQKIWPCRVRKPGILRKQLAGYYPRREKLMTKKQRRDKESSAEIHRKKINEDGRPSQAYRSFRISGRGIVKLARRCPRRKVSNKARIAAGS